MKVQFDHFFTFVDAGFVDNHSSKLKIEAKTTHQGQGTTASFSFFPKFYLEWIHLSNRIDAENNFLRLDRRADWQTSGWNPFGIGLRGQVDKDEQDLFLKYNPPYAPTKTIWVLRQSLVNKNIPMIFVQEMKSLSNDSDWWPETKQHSRTDNEIYIHNNHDEINIDITSIEPVQLDFDIKGINFRTGENFKAEFNTKIAYDLDVKHFQFVDNSLLNNE